MFCQRSLVYDKSVHEDTIYLHKLFFLR